MFKIIMMTVLLILISFFLLLVSIYFYYMGKKNGIERELKSINKIRLKTHHNYTILNPYNCDGDYLKAQLHTHTNKSDGKLSPDELVKRYKGLDYSFLAITDHDRITEYHEFDDEKFLTISGEEMTQSGPFWPLGHHISRLFVKKRLKERGLQSRIDRTHREGGVVVINHPSSISGLGTQCWQPHQLMKIKDYCLIEIVNHFSETEKNISYWHGLLKHYGPERFIWGIATDDAHKEEDINKDWIMIRVPEISEKALYNSLKKGCLYATQGPIMYFDLKGNEIFVSSEDKLKFIFIDADHNIRKEIFARETAYKPSGNEGFIRIEALDLNSDKKAWSQPFWIIEG
jgi:hypothetical protein